MVRITRICALGVALLATAVTTAPAVLAQSKAAPAAAPATGNLIDLNSASRDDLMILEGIGEVRADAIIRSRPFKAKTELVERHIIPEALYEKINDKVTARAVPAAPPPRPAAPPANQPKR